MKWCVIGCEGVCYWRVVLRGYVFNRGRITGCVRGYLHMEINKRLIACIYVCMNVRMHVCVSVYCFECMYVYVGVCMHVHVSVCL